MTRHRRQMQLAPLGRLLEVGAIGALNDGELLERFAARTGVEAELAFSVLVGRHGETVLRTCRGILGNEEDSLDAFQATFRMEYFLGPGDRRTVSTTFFGPDGVPAVRDEVRANGKTAYHLVSERGKPDTVQQVRIDDQTDRRDRYTGIMCSALWLWTPAGRPLSAHLASEGKLVVERDDKGRERVILIAKNARGGGGEVRCELDADRGWAIRRIELSGHCTWEVEKFILVDGRWFPAEGRCTDLDAPNRSTAFKASRWQVNRPIPAAKFELPDLPKGLRVFDHGQLIDGAR